MWREEVVPRLGGADCENWFDLTRSWGNLSFHRVGKEHHHPSFLQLSLNQIMCVKSASNSVLSALADACLMESLILVHSF